MSDPIENINTQGSYDSVAEEYTARIFDELRYKPLDRELLDRFAGRMDGPACDMGCGTGHVARYLHERGVNVCGMDLSPGMIAQARRLNPDIEFSVADMLILNVDDEAWNGITAFYSIIHIPRNDATRALGEFKRVLKPGGLLLLAFHAGSETIHLDEWWTHSVSVDFHFFQPGEMAGYLKSGGFQIEEIVERDPYPDVEHQSRRAYIFALKPT